MGAGEAGGEGPAIGQQVDVRRQGSYAASGHGLASERIAGVGICVSKVSFGQQSLFQKGC